MYCGKKKYEILILIASEESGLANIMVIVAFASIDFTQKANMAALYFSRSLAYGNIAGLCFPTVSVWVLSCDQICA